jgi:hypothetical protein
MSLLARPWISREAGPGGGTTILGTELMFTLAQLWSYMALASFRMPGFYDQSQVSDNKEEVYFN